MCQLEYYNTAYIDLHPEFSKSFAYVKLIHLDKLNVTELKKTAIDLAIFD